MPFNDEKTHYLSEIYGEAAEAGILSVSVGIMRYRSLMGLSIGEAYALQALCSFVTKKRKDETFVSAQKIIDDNNLARSVVYSMLAKCERAGLLRRTNEKHGRAETRSIADLAKFIEVCWKKEQQKQPLTQHGGVVVAKPGFASRPENRRGAKPQGFGKAKLGDEQDQRIEEPAKGSDRQSRGFFFDDDPESSGPTDYIETDEY